MKTALEILTDAGLHNSYWGKRIIKAEKRGEFTEGDVKKAGSWTTCACGKQDPRIPRDEEGAPCDVYLWELGLGFNGKVYTHQVVQAARTLVKIEKRAAIVLANTLRGKE